MGHLRLGDLPRTRKWDQVVELVKREGDAAAVAAAALDAAEKGFKQAAEDEGLGQATWLLTQLPLAARDPNYLDRLRGQPADRAAGRRRVRDADDPPRRPSEASPCYSRRCSITPS